MAAVVVAVVLYLLLRDSGAGGVVSPSESATASPSADVTTEATQTPDPTEEATSEAPEPTVPPNSQTQFCQTLVSLQPQLEAAINDMANLDMSNISNAKPPIDNLISLLLQIQGSGTPENMQDPLVQSLDYLQRFSDAIGILDYGALDQLSKEPTPTETMGYWQNEAEVYCTS
ncbi:MAG: hypothetical protein LBI84_01300 [Propionibacteriaceae bacterium]|nr:hypothetical protein [Propionibacteriaceae bacterium]